MRCRSCGSEFGEMGKRCSECGTTLTAPSRLSRSITMLEDTLVSIVLCGMVLLVLIQIILRNFFSTGITGGAEMVRHLVLWVAFLAAGITAREAKNIKIDVVYRMLPTGLRQFSEILTGLFSVIICGILIYASVSFILVDYRAGTVIAFFETPVWMLEIIIPVGYSTVMLRYLMRCKQSFAKLFKRE
jgi:TRAP-type C4-dicarboxylate transport system permease small subunit